MRYYTSASVRNCNERSSGGIGGGGGGKGGGIVHTYPQLYTALAVLVGYKTKVGYSQVPR